MIKYKDRYDYLVGALYQLKMNGKSGYYSAKQLLDTIGIKVDYDEIFQIGKYLQAKGYVKAEFIIGDTLMEITSNGILYWEEKKYSGIKSFQEFIDSVNLDKAIEKAVSANEQDDLILNARSDLLNTSKELLVNSEKYKDDFPDLYIDTQILNLELHKITPDPDILVNKLHQIDVYAQFKTTVSEIRRMLNFE